MWPGKYPMQSKGPGRNKGTANVRNKLTETEVIAIFSNRTQSQSRLADRYGVSQSQISHIKTGKTWGWLTRTLR